MIGSAPTSLCIGSPTESLFNFVKSQIRRKFVILPWHPKCKTRGTENSR